MRKIELINYVECRGKIRDYVGGLFVGIAVSTAREKVQISETLK